MIGVTTTPITFRRPKVEDGANIWHLVCESGTLDLNSVYAYLLMCDIFAHTCCAAYEEDRMIGFVLGFRKPMQTDTLFVWQIGVHETYRGRGIGKRLLQELLEHQQQQQDVRYIEATIGPSNKASAQLFRGMATALGTKCHIAEHYQAHHFPEAACHEAELMYRIGPIKPIKEVIE